MATNGVDHATAHLDWWAENLDNITVSPLTRDYPEATGESKRPIEAVESLTSTQATKDALKNLAKGGSTQIPFLAVLVVLISRLTGDEDISLGVNSTLDSSPFVLRVPVTSSESFETVCIKVAEAFQDGIDRPIDLTEVKTRTNTPILFRFAAFNSTSSDASKFSKESSIDLFLEYKILTDATLFLSVKYDQRLFSSARIAGILAQISQFIENTASNTSSPIGAIDFSTAEEKAVLPVPTSDLQWSNFRGAIHDIFSANAEKHPERICVVETKTETSAERVFTYRQIHEASNLLAHHLVQSGLELGDVVMIYSYRGVDLVVAIMGTLKAGGTFSVLDPAYPPDRQNIYLEVAKPTALVVIEKATQEAGQLDEKVRSFIAANLQLKTEVPALRLHDDGTTTGGQVGGKDVFESVQSSKAKSPGVVVGPDSTPTLSFTSGSEGKPKGVRGRHYSLAFYFDWMAKTFKLSENDKFTMLSGIAHDPIQRDIFTPLFLSARLLVPSRDDIANERLAEWMKEHGATVTHLTPAMGQILVGGATAVFDKLHHAFFVGDILIKRDCKSLQTIAPEVSIVNMYGTTETQRAVSYYEIPSLNQRPGFLDGMKDVIPAGKGMYNVQMLVVNRFDPTKLCAVGEIGEIYVRASGLAEEYLGTPELTQKKFVQNWFPGHEAGLKADEARFQEKFKDQPWAKYYLGGRDRLYRSGDLGRYTPTGDVECSGRADDQVKIRGFRIELGEIDTHLSQHPLIRENVTLVKRDKFEEQTLVSYVVPQMKTWEAFLKDQGLEDEVDDGSLIGRFSRFRPLQKEVQEYLKTKLPVYAVPSIIVPMRAMPLNPNGKIDKPKLPFPDTTMLSASRRRKSSMLQPQTEGEQALSSIWAKLIPGTIAKTIKPSESFFEIGGDSMKAQQLAYFIRRGLRVDLSISKIYNRPTLKDMAATVHRLRGADSLGGEQVEENTTEEEASGIADDIEYGTDAINMVDSLPQSFSKPDGSALQSPTIFLTGSTGFLGSFILRDLFSRKKQDVKVITLIRARDSANAFNRLKRTCEAYGVWSDEWADKITCLPGSLGPSKFGLSDSEWDKLASTVDVVIHNGAQVHWINTYSTLKAPNVLGTLEALKLCSEGKPKLFAFVSSTSVLDHEYFVQESEKLRSQGKPGVSEKNDMSGSSKGLGTGYGQSKWVSEYLCREAGRRGLRGSILRSGYILGDSKTGISNTDDFLIRMLKGCIQLRRRPNINNTVNMVPVDHVARLTVACAFNPPLNDGVSVAHVTGHPRLRMNEFLGALETYNYRATLTDYIPWASSLEDYVATHSDFALMPLFTFVANDLPSNTVAPELDDRNAKRSLYADRKWTGEDLSAGSGVTETTIGIYLAYLVAVGFLPAPGTQTAMSTTAGSSNVSLASEGDDDEEDDDKFVKDLPEVHVSPEQMKALANVGGRGTNA